VALKLRTVTCNTRIDNKRGGYSELDGVVSHIDSLVHFTSFYKGIAFVQSTVVTLLLTIIATEHIDSRRYLLLVMFFSV
jgi:hypothetical protein